MLELPSIFVLFFITLGPMKIIAPFVTLTAHADVQFCRTVAWRAILASTAVVMVLAIVSPLILNSWKVSFVAVSLTGGIILFLLSLQGTMKLSETPQQGGAEPTSTAMLISHLVIPTIITPPGIAAIVALMVLNDRGLGYWSQIIGLLLLVMLINWLTMLVARKLLALLTVPGLRVIGWVLAVLQASLGMQVIISSLRRLGALPMQPL